MLFSYVLPAAWNKIMMNSTRDAVYNPLTHLSMKIDLCMLNNITSDVFAGILTPGRLLIELQVCNPVEQILWEQDED
jgi:hypothetical protein